MKKIAILSFVAVMALFVFICGISAQEPEGEDGYSFRELNVAVHNPVNGSFFTPLWGNITSDIDARLLLHGYDLVKWDSETGVFLPDDTVVSGIVATTDGYGNRVFNIVLYSDLFYSDGTRITAWDYAFSTLLTMSKEAAEIGGDVRRPVYLEGYEDYISGEVPYLSGFRVIDDDMLSIRISADFLPFFYEMGLLSCNPYPIREIAPGVRVADDGKGVYLTNINGGDEPLFTADLLRRTILDPETGYLSHPKVTSGPYKLVSYEDHRAVFERNEYYKGDADGNIPSIPRITFESMDADQIVPALERHEVGLVNKVASADVILEAINASNNDESLAFSNYPRTGLGLISFNTERPIMNEIAVRQALAHLVDKDQFIEQTVGNFGLRTDGYYGMGQWMYQVLSGTLAYPVTEPDAENGMTDADYEKQLEEWEELTVESIPVYEYDPEAAAALLNAAGWNLNADGAAFRRGEDTLRYKRVDGQLVPLKLSLAYPLGTSAVAGLEQIAANAAAEGIQLSTEGIVNDDLLRQYHAVSERNYDMFFTALNFDVMFDPSTDFLVEDGKIPVWEETGFADQELYDRTVAMRSTKPGDLLTYCQRWLSYQQRIVETMPILPLYSNVYFDFYARVLHDYDITSNISWAEAILPAYLASASEGE